MEDDTYITNSVLSEAPGSWPINAYCKVDSTLTTLLCPYGQCAEGTYQEASEETAEWEAFLQLLISQGIVDNTNESIDDLNEYFQSVFGVNYTDIIAGKGASDIFNTEGGCANLVPGRPVKAENVWVIMYMLSKLCGGILGGGILEGAATGTRANVANYLESTLTNNVNL